MKEALKLTSPFSEAAARSLKAGDRVLFTGVIWTGRDAAHKRLVALLDGPCPAPPGHPIGSAGPTTSGRMDAYSPRLIADCGLRGMIGKGNRSAAVIDAMKQYGAVYFAATGGAGALIARCIRKCEIIAFPDLGPEAIHRLEVENFPLVVAIDSLGNNLYH